MSDESVIRLNLKVRVRTRNGTEVGDQQQQQEQRQESETAAPTPTLLPPIEREDVKPKSTTTRGDEPKRNNDDVVSKPPMGKREENPPTTDRVPPSSTPPTNPRSYYDSKEMVKEVVNTGPESIDSEGFVVTRDLRFTDDDDGFGPPQPSSIAPEQPPQLDECRPANESIPRKNKKDDEGGEEHVHFRFEDEEIEPIAGQEVLDDVNLRMRMRRRKCCECCPKAQYVEKQSPDSEPSATSSASPVVSFVSTTAGTFNSTPSSSSGTTITSAAGRITRASSSSGGSQRRRSEIPDDQSSTIGSARFQNADGLAPSSSMDRHGQNPVRQMDEEWPRELQCPNCSKMFNVFVAPTSQSTDTLDGIRDDQQQQQKRRRRSSSSNQKRRGGERM